MITHGHWIQRLKCFLKGHTAGVFIRGVYTITELNQENPPLHTEKLCGLCGEWYRDEGKR